MADVPRNIMHSPKRLAAYAAPIVVALLLFPEVFGTYQTMLLTYGLVMALAALGFNILLGYTGLLSFGHSAYFGMGAYSAAFMVKYLGVSSMEIYIVGGMLITGIVSAVFGYICVRHTRIFFAILTLALAMVLWSLALKLFWVTGGTDGIRVPWPSLLGGLLTFQGGGFHRFIHHYYYYVLVVFLIGVVVMWVIVHSPFGKALQAIRDNETRARFLGVRVRQYRWIAFLVSGLFTGLAGILWVPLNGLVTPDIVVWLFSGEIVFMTVLGGFRNFTGPIVGAVVFNYLKTYSIAFTEYWQMALGVVLIILVLALPTGIVGALARVTEKLKSKGKS